MRLWRVHVQCTQQADARGLCPRCYEDCIVDAENSVEALRAGREFIESLAPTDVLWAEFEALSASSITLPLHV